MHVLLKTAQTPRIIHMESGTAEETCLCAPAMNPLRLFQNWFLSVKNEEKFL